MNWEEANQLWSTVRNPSKGKPLGNNTRLYPKVEFIFPRGRVVIGYEIQLHGNTIITVFPDDSQILDSCGWKTVTTKERLNKWALTETYTIPGTSQKLNRYYLFQRNFDWYIRDIKLNTIRRFFDEMVLVNETSNTRIQITFNYPQGIV